jgi:hypothetical protein
MNHFLQSWRSLWQYRYLIGISYLIMLFSALVILLPLKALLESKAGYSLSIGKLAEGLDYTFITDFNNAFEGALTPVFQQSYITVMIVVVLLVFIMGGAISLFLSYPAKYKATLFWGQSAHYFWRMLRLVFYFWLMQGLLLMLFGLIYFSLTNGFSLTKIEDDSYFLRYLLWLMPPYLLLAVSILMWQDYAKVRLVTQDTRWLFQPIWASFHFLRRHYLSAFLLYLMYMVLLVFCIYLQSKFIPNISSFGLSFVSVQLFVLFRLSIRLANLAGVAHLSKSDANN